MGVVIKKTTPSLQAYLQSYKQKWKMLFFGGFPREREREREREEGET